MALFKIFKGNQTDNLINKNAAGYRQPVDGYAYYNTSNKWLYIDADYDGNGIITREPINAYSAKVDSVGNVINTTYGAKLNCNGNTLTLRTANDIDISSVSLPTYSTATTSAAGLMSAADKTKLNGIATGAEVNQNAFSNIKIGSTTVAADSKTDTVEFVGSHITITPDATNDKITFSLTSTDVTDALGYTPPTTNTTYSNATQSAAGLMSAADKTKLDGVATGAEVNQNAFGKVKVGSTTVEADAKIDTLELVGSNVTLTPDATNDKVTIGITQANVVAALGYTPPTTNTTYSNATQSAAGLMSAADKTKLDGVATGAEVNQNTFSTVAVLASGSGTATNVAADSKTDTLTLAGSSTVTLAGDTTNDKVTFSLTKANVTTALGYTPPQQDTTYSNATQSAAGLMSAADKTKLDGVATGAEVNQNAFSKVAVSGQTTVEADAKTDTLTLAGSNVTITTTANTDTITIGLTSSNVTSALGYTPPQQDTTYSAATQSTAGLMSAADKKKLDGIATGAQVNVIESVSASGTAPLTLSASISSKAVSITGSVADASTSAKGVVKLDATTLNTWINQLSTGSSTPVDADYYISQYVGGGTSTTTYHRRPMSALWSYISGKISAAGYAKTANVVTNVAWDGTNKKLTKTIGSTTSDVVTASTLKTDLGLSSAMLFMGTLGEGGTISTLPSASTANQGYTYKVIVAGTYANLAAKIGDVFVSNGSGWVLIPSGDEPSGTVTNIATGSGLTGGPITSTGTISHSNSVTAQTTQAIYPIKIDACGHISAYGAAVVPLTAASTLDATKLSGTIPAACYTNTTYGLANYNANGLVKPWYSHTSASTGPTAGSNATAVAVNAITTTAGKYYAVEMDSVGRMFVNVPWTNVNSSYLTAHQTVTNKNASLSWGTAITIATVGSTNITATLPANPNTNYYHKTGSWNGLTYTAAKEGSPADLAFTIPTGTTATTVALGNHTHTTSLAGDTGTATVTLAHGNKYKLTAGGTSVIFQMPNDNNTDTKVTQGSTTTTSWRKVLTNGASGNVYSAWDSAIVENTDIVYQSKEVAIQPSTGTLAAKTLMVAGAVSLVYDSTTQALNFIFA